MSSRTSNSNQLGKSQVDYFFLSEKEGERFEASEDLIRICIKPLSNPLTLVANICSNFFKQFKQ